MSELASMGAGCDWPRCVLVGEIIIKTRYMGVVKRLCTAHFVQELGWVEVQRWVDGEKERLRQSDLDRELWPRGTGKDVDKG
jgi:hypothetical protein